MTIKTPLRFNMLLNDAGIAPTAVRILRHQTDKVARGTPYTLWRDNRLAFEQYQSTQDSAQRARFAGDFWASFVAPPNGSTLFVGLYEVQRIGIVPDGTIDLLSGVAVGYPKASSIYDQYQCVQSQVLSEYVGRLSVHWGDSASSRRAWVQRADNQDKEIVELTRDFQEEAFPGFSTFARSLSEIETMPGPWKSVLAANKGVYLLACPRTREQYVGSAYGVEGFLGRWREYAATGHGGNAEMRIRDPSDYAVSILEVVGSNAVSEDIIRLEGVWKQELLSRSIGLNRN